MKKLINNPEHVVQESLKGLAAAHRSLLRLHLEPNFVCRADSPVRDKVALVSGGGSGHEPMHVGFVGYGMLDAACPGEVFTSPTPDQMLEATKATDGGAGVLYIVKNYSGDVMNFEMAAEMAASEGLRVQTCLINDDVAVENSEYSQGRRGVGTTVLAEKICGAAAEQGRSLEQIARIGEKVNANGRSMGMALTSCTVPMKGSPTFDLGPTEVEIGIGIHGERGRYREPLKPAQEIVQTLAQAVINDLPFRRGDQVLAFVNGMGGTPAIELYIVYKELAEVCGRMGLSIVRNLVGPYITSLEMQGTSLTLLRMDDDLLKLWDHPVCTPALRWGM